MFRLRPMLAAILILALVAPAALAAEPPEPIPQGDPVAPQRAMADLESLDDYERDKKATNEELRQYMEQVYNAYANFAKPPEPEVPEKPEAPENGDEAAAAEYEAELEAWKTAQKAHDDWERTMRRFEKDQEDFNEDAIDLFIDLLALQKIDRRSETNLRDPVNIRAAQLLGALAPHLDEDEARKISKRIMGVIERLEKAKYQVNTDHLQAAFAALAQINHPSALEWMKEEFIHTRNQPEHIYRLQAAHKAMPMFKAVPGKLRYDIVDDMTKLYSSTELSAEKSSTSTADIAAKEFWDRIRIDAIAAVQYFADEPTDENGQVLNKMNDLFRWFQDNDNPRKEPWVDPE